MRRVHSKTSKSSIKRDAARGVVSPAPASHARAARQTLPSAPRKEKPESSRPTLSGFPAASRRETWVKDILKLTAGASFKSGSVLKLFIATSAGKQGFRIEDGHLQALVDAFQQALGQGNDLQAQRIAAVLLHSMPSAGNPQGQDTWRQQFLAAVRTGVTGSSSRQASMLGRLSQLAENCSHQSLAQALRSGIPGLVETALHEAAQADEGALTQVLAQLKAGIFRSAVDAALLNILRSSIKGEDKDAALRVAGKFLARTLPDDSARLNAFRHNFRGCAEACPRELEVELLEGVATLAGERGHSRLAAAFNKDAEGAKDRLSQWQALRIDLKIGKAALHGTFDALHAQLDSLHEKDGTPGQQLRTMGAALTRCLQRAQDWESVAPDVAVILSVMVNQLLDRAPAPDIGAPLYQLIAEGAEHWNYGDRKALQSLVVDIAARNGIQVESTLPELRAIEAAIDISDTALFKALEALPSGSDLQGATTGFQLLMDALERMLEQGADFQVGRVNRILVAMHDQASALSDRIHPNYFGQQLYLMLNQVTLDWSEPDRQRLRNLAEEAFSE